MLDPKARIGELGPELQTLLQKRDARLRSAILIVLPTLAGALLVPLITPTYAAVLGVSTDWVALVSGAVVWWVIAGCLQLVNVMELRAHRTPPIAPRILGISAFGLGVLVVALWWMR